MQAKIDNAFHIMDETIRVKVLLNGVKILTVTANKTNNYNILTIPRNHYYNSFLPDSDRLIAECENGYRYKRIQCHSQEFFIFKMI